MSAELTPIEKYRQSMMALNQSTPIGQSDLARRVSDLQMLSTNRPRKNIYDMAASLGGGLTSQAQSGRPSSIGYGLSMGFDSFNDQINKNKQLAEQEAQSLRMAAYEELQAERNKVRSIDETVASNIFKSETEAAAAAAKAAADAADGKGGSFGSSYKAQLLNAITRGANGEIPLNSPDYIFAWKILSQKGMKTDPTTGQTYYDEGMDLGAMGFPVPPASGVGAAVQQPVTSANAGAQGKLQILASDPEADIIYTTAQMQANGPMAGKSSPSGKPVYINGYKGGVAFFTDAP